MNHLVVCAPIHACFVDAAGCPEQGLWQSGGPQEVGGAASCMIKAPTLNAVQSGSGPTHLNPGCSLRDNAMHLSHG